MTLRALRLRNGRVALPRPLAPIVNRSNQRPYSTELHLLEETSNAPELAPVGKGRVVALNDPNHPVALDYAFYQHQRKRLQSLGAATGSHYTPKSLLRTTPSPKDITLELLVASQSHLGHATGLWHPANAQYIFGVRGDVDPIHIISPDVTAAHLRRACKVLSGVTERGGLVLFVGTRRGQEQTVVRAAQVAKGCHLFTKWIPGSITNGQAILGRCAKKVVNELDEDVNGFEDQLHTKAAIKPDLVVCLNPLENYILLRECGVNNIPTIGIIDTDANPTWVTYPIAANDDSLRCVQLVAGALGRAGQEGQEKRLEKAKKGVIEYQIAHGLAPPKREEKGGSGKQQRSSAPSAALLAAQQALSKLGLPQHKDTASVSQLSTSKAPSQDVENKVQRESQVTVPTESISEVAELDEDPNEAELGQQLGYSISQSPGGIPHHPPPQPARTSPLPEISENEHKLSADDPEADISYIPSATEASAPKTYAAAAARSDDPTADESRAPITDLQRQLSELDPEMDPIYQASPDDNADGAPRRRLSTEELFEALQQDPGEDAEPDLQPEYDAANMPAAKTAAVAEASGASSQDDSDKSTWDQVTDAEKELGDAAPEEDTPEVMEQQEGTPGVAPEEPVVEAPTEEEKPVKEVKKRGRPPKAKK